MTITTLIEKLTEIRETHGDLAVAYRTPEGWNFHIMETKVDISFTGTEAILLSMDSY